MKPEPKLAAIHFGVSSTRQNPRRVRSGGEYSGQGDSQVVGKRIGDPHRGMVAPARTGDYSHGIPDPCRRGSQVLDGRDADLRVGKPASSGKLMDRPSDLVLDGESKEPR